MKVLNTETEDYHVHSINYSDGMCTIDEIVQFAGKIGMKTIAICDHSQAANDTDQFMKKNFRSAIKRWKNVHNKVNVIFGVEADLLNKQGDICAHIQGIEGTFIILSYHDTVYHGNLKSVVEGFINAIRRFHKQISFIGHICWGLDESDVKRIILEANKFHVPLELNAKYYLQYPESWDVLLKNADQVYINSDAHNLYDLKTLQKEARALLKKKKYIK